MKVYFIGNSHLIAIKDGLALTTSPLAEAPTYIMAPGATLELEITSEAITSLAPRAMIVSPSGRDEKTARLEDADAFFLIGLGMSPGQCARVYRTCRMWKHAEPGKRLISQALFQALIRQLLLDSLPFKAARELRAVTTKPIVMVSQPLPPTCLQHMELKNDRHTMGFERFKIMFDADVARTFFDVFVAAARAACAEIGVAFVEQPEQTRDPVFSKDEFMSRTNLVFYRDALDTRRETPNAVEDVSHMNAAYGVHMVRAMEQALASEARASHSPA
jgi:hypothetical protein